MRNTDTTTIRTRIARTLVAVMAAVVVLSTVGPVAPAAAHAGHGPVSIAQSTDASDVEPGDNVTVQSTINATGLDAPVIDLTLPDGWAVESYSMVEGPSPIEFKEQTNEWLWFEAPAEGPYTIQYTLSVPDNATDGSHAIDAEGSAFDPDANETVTDTTSTSVTVASADENQAPSADFSWSPTNADPGENVTFDASGSEDPDGSIASYAWDFDGDGDFEAQGGQVEHAFADEGDHSVTLRVTDDAGANDTTTQDVSVASPESNEAPSVNLTATPGSVTIGDEVTLEADATDPDGDELTYTWEQVSGPGSPSLPSDDGGTVSPSEAGTYTFRVTVEDPSGANGSDDATVQVTETTYAVGQAGQCVIEMVPLGDGTETGPEYYDYDEFGSFGTMDLQETYLSQFYVYEGSDGTNLVILHDQLDDGTGGGAVTFNVSGLPTDGEWTVEDDDYGELGLNDSNQDDQFVHDGSRSEMNWMYGFNTTDGGVFLGLGEDGWSEITIDPAFKEESYGHEVGWDLSTEGPNDWEARSAGDVTEPLVMDQPVSIRQGACGAVSPDAALSAPENATAGSTVTLDASNPDSPTAPIEYQWDFEDDGDVDLTTENATVDHQYDEAGEVTAAVTVVDRFGNDDTATTPISVTEDGESNSPPSVELTAEPSTVEVGDAVNLTATASDPDGDALEYTWTQLSGNGSLDLPDGSDGTVTPPEADTYEVQVSVEDAEGATASDAATFEASEPNEPPSAEFSWAPTVPTAGEEVTFDASNATDADGDVTTYEWDFDGDGSVDDATTSPTTTHDFESAGEHPVVLTVTDDDGATDDATEQVTVEAPNQPPTAAFSWTPTNPDPGENVTFDAADADDPDGSIESYAWDVDGDGEFEAQGQQVTHAFDSEGEQEVSLEVTDGEGATDETVRAIAVGATNQPPSVELDARPSTVTVGDEVELEAVASDPNADDLDVSWEQLSGPAELSLPEGTTGTVTPPESGTYEVAVTVEDPEGASDSATVTIGAEANQPPEAAFDHSPESPETGERVSFDATASDDPDGSIASYAWDVDGDGEFEESGRTASHTYEEPGSHEVTLSVTDERGATDTKSETIDVDERDGNEAPIATLAVSLNPVEMDDPVTFDASGSTDPDGDDGDLEFEWTVVSAPPNASLPSFEGESTEEVFLDAVGDWEVQVTVTDPDGGTDSATTTVESKVVPQIHVDDVRVEEGTIEASETAHVNATVHNAGTATGSANVSLVVDGEIVETATVEVGPEEVVPLVFTRQFDQPGTYDLTVGGESVQLLVEEPSSDSGSGPGSGSGSGPSDSAPGSGSESDDGDAGNVTTTTGTDSGTDPSDSTDTTTSSETSTTSTSEGTTSSSQRAESEPTPTATPNAGSTETEAPGQPGFGAAIAVLALLAAALLAWRRS